MDVMEAMIGTSERGRKQKELKSGA